MPEIFSQIINIIVQVFEYFRIAAIIISILMVFLIFLLMAKTQWLRDAYLENTTELLKNRPYEANKFLKQWKGVSAKLKTGNEQAYKLAVIEADALLEEALEKMKFKGETIRDRLNQIPKTILEDTKDIEQAHQIRDNIVHDPDYEVTLDQAKKVLFVYEKVLKQLT